MTTEMTPAPLAIVKPGGCIHFATVPYDRARDLIGDAYCTGTRGIGYSQQIMEPQDAILSIPPSPADQGDAITAPMMEAAANALARWAGQADGSRCIHETRSALEVAIFTGQAVGK
ncbi:hypothetical protein AB4071_01720 [Stenotrophomonas sp. 2MCAF14_2]|uniref:hypothetical protein n=1 Tax=Stenotrophomonas sp. 2MCAF14_2 TaxID=3232983 RepID=UPI003F99A5A1